MAKDKKKKEETNMPEGFVPLGMTRVEGWFVREAGNTIQGTLADSFTTKGTGKFNKGKERKVYKIEITNGTTRVMNGDGEVESITEGLVGLDETGWLKKLGDLEKGREVFIRCKGKEDPSDRESPWIFDIGVVPF